MTIRLQFSAGSSIASKAIQYVTRGWTTHVDVVLPSGELLGARLSGGVAIRPPGYTRFARVQRVLLPCGSATEKAFLQFLNAQVGKPYDWTADLAFALDRDWRETDSWMCSELVSAALERSAFFRRPLDTPANRVSPAMLLFALGAVVAVI